MVRFSRIAVAALGIFILASCSPKDPASSDSTAVAATAASDPAADKEAIRAVNTAWFKAHGEGNVDSVVGHYASDAVVSAPGVAPLRGTAAIREAMAKEIEGMKAAGLSQTAGPNPEIEISGDLGYEWNTVTITDKAGKTIDTGKYLTVFSRRDGKWVIVRDIWNSDAAPPASN